ncbi:MAG: nuclear transport factor 2 family protein [Candidatus Cloacimonetes bacterium]|nr:nuclear transport factor 2 family protein [Candidatus Cloacimonadota bacterium]MBS3766679.1 nuclear transport factor 2 family protein [Candidatus Cloacimonadota bacterium]
MNTKDPKLIVLQFNECINNQNIQCLRKLMSSDHVFIDSSNGKVEGKENMLSAWKEFFESYPDYKNHFSRIKSSDNLVLITGYSSCSHKPLDGPVIWTAKVENDKVTEWRVYADTPENRNNLGLQ